jgi:inward rectifier potassium channel
MTSPTLTGQPPSTASAAQEDFRDLGFGTEVAKGTRRRLLNRDGSFNVVLDGLGPLSSLSLYHWLLTISWPRFLAFIASSYVAVNAVFAFAFLLCGPDALQSSAGSFAGQPFYRAFFFSVDTFATIGYGNIIPVGVVANTLVTIEALLNIVGVALATGVIFARFSRPSARIIYSRNAIVAPYRDRTALEFRIANARRSQLIDVQVQAILTKIERISGTAVRKFYELTLERNRVVFFPLSWTVVHPIDSSSPIWGLTHADLVDGDAELLVLLIGTDETVSQTVHSRSSYQADEIVWGAKFANMFMRTEGEGIIGMNLSRIHDIEAVYSL